MRVAVIGAGPAGLAFSDRLTNLSKDLTIDIFEQSSYVGGISKTVNYKGNRIDIGGHRFFSKSDEVMNWWANKFPIDTSTISEDQIINYQNSSRSIDGLKIATQVDRESNRVMLLRKRKSRILYSKKMYDYPLRLNVKTLKNIGLIQLAQVTTSYLKSKVKSNEPKNLEEFIVSRFGTKLYSMFFESYTEKVWGRHPRDISPEWGIQRIKGLSVRKLLLDNITKALSIFKFVDHQSISQKKVETSLIERFLYPKFGPGQMWEEVSKDLIENNVSIYMNTKVTKIDFGESSTRVKSISAIDIDGKEITNEYDYVISTMPIKELVNSISGNKQSNIFTKEIRDIASKLPYRDFITVGLLLNSLSGPDDERLDDTWIYVQEPNVKVGRIQIFNNWSPYLVADSSKFWIGLEYFCNEGDDLWMSSDQDLIELAKQETLNLGLCDENDFLDATVLKESKTYPAYFDTYNRFNELMTTFDKIENLYLIGRNGMHKYNNQDHSMLSGFRAAEQIVQGRVSANDKSTLWLINAEQEYHEES